MSNTDKQEGLTLTLSEIQSSENLRKLGALSGDRIVDNKLVRVFSKPEDSVMSGQILTGEDVLNSPNLQNLNAKAGDRIVDNKLVRSERDNALMQLKYGFGEGTSITENMGVWLESVLPIGEINIDFSKNDFSAISYESPEEMYGEGFMDASPEERREMIIARKERQLQHDYGQFFDPNEDSIARKLGNIGGLLATPTTAIPFFGEGIVQWLWGGYAVDDPTINRFYPFLQS